MLECLIVGDSIAQGVSNMRKECVAHTQVGINSANWNRKYGLSKTGQKANAVIISLGSNDHDGVHTFRELMTMRERIQSDHVYWIMPAIKPNVQEIIKIIATNYGDTILPITNLSKDGVHPTARGYKELAGETK